jgi:ADP-ribosylglycohydrolase
MRLTWIQPEDLLPHELAACRDEGRDVSEASLRWATAGGLLTPPAAGASAAPAAPALRALALSLLDELDASAPPSPPTAFAPGLAAPSVAAPGLAAPGLAVPSLAALGSGGTAGAQATFDRIHGAWLGRAAGCLLGKPVEKIARQGIRAILEAAGRWPLTGYFTAVGLPDEVAAAWPWNRRSAPTSLAENIDGMPEDDDLNFALLALHILETYGRDFTSEDVAQAWLDGLPAGRVFTAERVAYRNLLLGLTPPDTATHHNPFREWIGALIRADVYGWVNPGRPDRATEMAARDASVSHVRDGILGAMWVGAMTSVAPVMSAVDEVLDVGESVLGDCRLAEVIREARVLGAQGDWEKTVDALEDRHGHLHWVHVRNNAALIAAALAHGQGDFARSICAVVSGGWDTDSNGATVGSITGALTGAAALPPPWIVPLHDSLHTSLAGLDGVTFTELTSRTLAIA